MRYGLGLSIAKTAGRFYKSFFQQFGTPAAAYSLRNLGGGGNVVRVRRSSDDEERDFKPTEINNGTLLSWVNGADGLVTSYDSLVDTKDATQITATLQPQIVDAGTLETIGSDAAINFLSTATRLTNSSTFTGINSSSVVSFDIDFETSSDVSTRQNFLAFNDSGNAIGCAIFVGRLYIEGWNGGVVAGGYISIAANTRYKITTVWNGTTLSAVYLNGVSQSITASSIGLINSTGQGLQIGANTGGSFPFFGKIVTVLAYREIKDAAHNLGFTNAY